MSELYYSIYFVDENCIPSVNTEKTTRPANDFSKEMSVLSNHRDINTILHSVDYAHKAEIKRG
ncbi:MAG: hypothetical protein E6R13_07055 [Spirochaetes bacterium]|nr:MAG: hypothetical protein E6R13_07055 [Spirochaetota bacterium]